MRFSSLGSGSEGNALLVEAGPAHQPIRLLIDCGMPLRELGQRLAQRDLGLEDLDLIAITHEHGDHIGGLGPVARATGLPVLMTHGTALAAGPELLKGVQVVHLSPHRPIELLGVRLQPIPVPHDAREPVAYVVEDHQHRLGVVTDLGSPTSHLIQSLQDLDGLFLEFNHDRAMLAAGDYPPKLKARVGGDQGHLDNHAAAEILKCCLSPRLQRVVAAHLSQKNNHPDRVAAAVEPLDLSGTQFEIATQHQGMPWVALATD